MRSRVMPYSCPMASSVRLSTFCERPNGSVRTLRERSGSPASRSLVTVFGENESMVIGAIDSYYILCSALYQVRALLSNPTGFSPRKPHLGASRHEERRRPLVLPCQHGRKSSACTSARHRNGARSPGRPDAQSKCHV